MGESTRKSRNTWMGKKNTINININGHTIINQWFWALVYRWETDKAHIFLGQDFFQDGKKILSGNSFYFAILFANVHVQFYYNSVKYQIINSITFDEITCMYRFAILHAWAKSGCLFLYKNWEFSVRGGIITIPFFK